MLTVSQSAQDQIAEHFKTNEIKPIRIFFSQGCSGSLLKIAIDEKRDTDKVFNINGIEYVVEKKLLRHVQPIKVDFMETGFRISSNLKLGNGCSCCGSTASCS